MKSYCTDSLPPAGRASAWNTLYSQQMNRVDLTPADRTAFSARLSLGKLGAIQFARMSTSRINIERSSQHIQRGVPRLYSFLLQTKGRSQLRHCGHEARLEEGDFVLCDSAAPHSFTVEDDSRIVMLRLDAATIRGHFPAPDQYCGVALKKDVGLTSAASAMVEALDLRLEGGFNSVYDTRFARQVLDMLAMTYAIGFEQHYLMSAAIAARQSEVIRYIEENLRDPDLSPAAIAAGMRISPRYLRAVFSRRGEKVSAYIIRRRLEECARQIANPSWAGHTLTEIAFAWGFNSAAHFARSFHDHYGMPPREYRRRASN